MPHPYGWGDNQGRDIGALANGLRQLEENAEFYVLDERTEIDNPEVKLASFRHLSDAQWWSDKGQGILLTTFGTKLMQPIYAAAKQAGWTVWARMDCDGIPGPDGNKRKYIIGRMVESIDRRRRKKCDLSGTFPGGCEGILRAAMGLLLIQRVRERLRCSYEMIDRMLVETHLAQSSFFAYFEKIGRKDLAAKVCLLPPAISETFCLPENTSKSGVVAVGQWFRWQKNLDLLTETILKTVEHDRSLPWTVVGNGANYVQEALQPRLEGAGENIRFFPHTSPGELAAIYQKARVIFYSSRQEGFPNTLCEALCSGTTMVAPRGIQAFEYCSQLGWGSLYDKPDMAAMTVSDELMKWQTGHRRPDLISAEASALFHRKNVARKLCRLASETEARPVP